MTLVPFADDAASVAIGKLTVENGTDQVSGYGNLDINPDKGGLANARVLESLLDQDRSAPDGREEPPRFHRAQ